jgi:hypothetical protein
MNCEFMTRWAALAASDDLGPDEQAQLTAHLAECESCRRAAAEFSSLREDLAVLGDDVLDPAIYAAVRQGVLDQIADRTNWHMWAAIAAAVVLMALATWWRWHGREAPIEIQPPPLQVYTPPIPDIAPEVVPAVIRRPGPRRQRAHREVRNLPAEGQTLVVKMLTDDPDVVIIWLVDKEKTQEIER